MRLRKSARPTETYWTPERTAKLRRMVSRIAAEPVDEMVRTVIRAQEKRRGSKYMKHGKKREAAKIRRILEIALCDKEVLPLYRIRPWLPR